MAKYYMTLVIETDDALDPSTVHTGKGHAHLLEQAIRDKLQQGYMILQRHRKDAEKYPDDLLPKVDIHLAEACPVADRMEFHKRFIFGA